MSFVYKGINIDLETDCNSKNTNKNMVHILIHTEV